MVGPKLVLSVVAVLVGGELTGVLLIAPVVEVNTSSECRLRKESKQCTSSFSRWRVPFSPPLPACAAGLPLPPPHVRRAKGPRAGEVPYRVPPSTPAVPRPGSRSATQSGLHGLDGGVVLLFEIHHDADTWYRFVLSNCTGWQIACCMRCQPAGCHRVIPAGCAQPGSERAAGMTRWMTRWHPN